MVKQKPAATSRMSVAITAASPSTTPHYGDIEIAIKSIDIINTPLQSRGLQDKGLLWPVPHDLIPLWHALQPAILNMTIRDVPVYGTLIGNIPMLTKACCAICHQHRLGINDTCPTKAKASCACGTPAHSHDANLSICVEVDINGSAIPPQVLQLIPADILTPGSLQAVPRRQAELAVGRLLAGWAIATLGGTELWVKQSHDRSPQWPAGFTGSISHSAETIICWVQKQSLPIMSTSRHHKDMFPYGDVINSDVLNSGFLNNRVDSTPPDVTVGFDSVGIDVEHWLSPTTAQAIAATVLTDLEWRVLERSMVISDGLSTSMSIHNAAMLRCDSHIADTLSDDSSDGSARYMASVPPSNRTTTALWSKSQLVSLVFAAKEALFKALYPRVGHFFDFSAAAVVSWQPGRLQLQLTQALGLTPQTRIEAGQCFTLYYQRSSAAIYCFAAIN